METVLEIEDLSVAYQTNQGPIHAVSDVNMTIDSNEIMGLIGESGSGKSTMAYAIMRLLKGNARVVKGRIRVMGEDVYDLSEKALLSFRWDSMAMVFQSAMSSLNPVMTVQTQMIDTLLSHRKHMKRRQAIERAHELMELVRIDPKHLNSYPHELSGGMRQRVVIAIAISLNPGFVIMDEPTTALDVVVQRSILDQIKDIQRKEKFAILFISHDFSLVTEFASRIGVMYAGRIVESTDSKTLRIGEKHHPYTAGLLKAIPHLSADEVIIEGISGHPPNLADLPSGCAFHPRCPYAMSQCRDTRPVMNSFGPGVAECHLLTVEEEMSHG